MSCRADLPACADVVVVGGGIIGCSTAYYLARRGLSVVVCEKGVVAGEQSSRNWGFVRKQGRDAAELPLMLESERLWSGLARELGQDLGFVRAGTVCLSDSERSEAWNMAWLELGRGFGLDTRYLSARELGVLLPGLRGGGRGALYTPSDARAEPGVVTAAMARGVVGLGGTVLERCAVRGVDVEAGRVAGVVTECGRIKAPVVVCAGGAWSSYFCRSIGVGFPQIRVVGSVMATEAGPLVAQASIWRRGLGMRRCQDGGYTIACGGRSDCFITPDSLRFFRWFARAHRHARVKGRETISLRLGAGFFWELTWPSRWSLESVTQFEKTRVLAPAPNRCLLTQAHEQLGRTFPALAGIKIKSRWAGVIDVTPDELPLIGEVESLPGFYLSTGFSGHGFGPGAGKVTAELVAGTTPCVDLSAFGVARFS